MTNPANIYILYGSKIVLRKYYKENEGDKTMKKVLLTSAVVLTAFGAYNSVNAEDVTVPSITANTSTYVQTLKQKIKLVETGYTYYDAKGDKKEEPADPAKATALTKKVEAVQSAINELTKLQNEYKTVYARYHEALTDRQTREAKQEELAAAVKTAADKLNKLLIDQAAFNNVNEQLKTEFATLSGADTVPGSLAAAEKDLASKESALEKAKQDLADYKANNVTKLAADYDTQVATLTTAVDVAQRNYNEAKATVATRSARLDQLETDISNAMDVDYATGYAIRQGSKELRAARKAQADNDGKLAAAKKLVDGDTSVTPARVGLKAKLDTLTAGEATDGSIAKAKAELKVKIEAANTEFATIDPAKAKAIGLTFELDKIKSAVEEVIAQNPVKPAETPATPAPAKAAWVQSGSSWWYKHADGSYTTNGWEKINGTWYHFDQAGWMQTGWVKDGNTWYYLNGSGAMQTGWVKDNGTWYYLNSNGSMATGWYKVGDKWYYSYASGALAVNTTVDGYKVNHNGEWV